MSRRLEFWNLDMLFRQSMDDQRADGIVYNLHRYRSYFGHDEIPNIFTVSYSDQPVLVAVGGSANKSVASTLYLLNPGFAATASSLDTSKLSNFQFLIRPMLL